MLPAVGTYVFHITVNDGDLVATDEVMVLGTGGLDAGASAVIEGLRPVWPNPARANAAFSFGIARDGSPVRLTMHDVSGRRIATLVNDELAAGEHHATWDGCDENGRFVASGVYFVVLDVDGHRSSDKVTLLR